MRVLVDVEMISSVAVPLPSDAIKCPIKAQSVLIVFGLSQQGTFAKLTPSSPICNLQTGYVPFSSLQILEGQGLTVAAAPVAAAPGAAPTGNTETTKSGATPKTAQGVAGPSKAFLDVIAYAEGTRGKGNDGYNVMFTGKLFSGYRDHPRKIMRSGRYASDAAGRYQFLSKTWDGAKKQEGYKDFSPPYQDKGGLYLMRGRGVSNYTATLNYTDFSRAVYKLGKEWASLPGSPYGQPIKPIGELWGVYASLTKQ